MANKPYDNELIENEVEDQYNSHLDLNQFCSVDNGLEAVDGMKVTIHRYSATNGTEELDEGEGNTKTIEASYTDEEYVVKRIQNKVTITDEAAMKDSMIPYTLAQHRAVDMFNYVMGRIYGEFKKATLVLPVKKFDFDSFAYGASMLKGEDLDPNGVFALVNPKDLADVKIALKTSLIPNNSLVGNGLIGTVNNIKLYVKDDATQGIITIATKKAVTVFNKQGVSSEEERHPNEAYSDIFLRKYFTVALTDENYAVKVAIGEATKTTDSTVDTSKTYYVVKGAGYLKVAKPVDADIANYYEIA